MPNICPTHPARNACLFTSRKGISRQGEGIYQFTHYFFTWREYRGTSPTASNAVSRGAEKQLERIKNTSGDHHPRQDCMKMRFIQSDTGETNILSVLWSSPTKRNRSHISVGLVSNYNSMMYSTTQMLNTDNHIEQAVLLLLSKAPFPWSL